MNRTVDPARQPRRRLLGAALALAAPASWTSLAGAVVTTDAERALRSGPGRVVLVRHARTVPGTGDPPGFDLAVCSTQRILSEEGQAQSRRMGAWFARRSLVPTAVRSSPWCRCLDTGRLAFARPATEAWDPLASTFAERSGQSERQTAQLRAALGERRAESGFEVWVTHMVNIQALAGVTVAMGEALVVRAGTGTGAQAVEVLAQWAPGG